MNEFAMFMGLAWVVNVALFGWIGHAVGKGKNLATEGAFLGALLGPLGVLIVAVLQGSKKSSENSSRAQSWAAKEDPFAAWEAREKASTILPPPAKKTPES